MPDVLDYIYILRISCGATILHEDFGSLFVNMKANQIIELERLLSGQPGPTRQFGPAANTYLLNLFFNSTCRCLFDVNVRCLL